MKRLILSALRVLRDKTPNFWDKVVIPTIGPKVASLWDWCKKGEGG